MPGATIEITRAEIVAAEQAPGGRRGPGPMLPAHCRVNGIVDKRTGADGKTYGIRGGDAGKADRQSGRWRQASVGARFCGR